MALNISNGAFNDSSTHDSIFPMDLIPNIKFIEHHEAANLQEYLQIMKEYQVLKTLLLKGKTKPVLVVALESTKFSISNISKHLGEKDLRINDSFLSSVGLDRLNLHPFVNVNDCAVLVDSQVLNAQNLAFRATSGTKSALITGQMLKDYYDLNFPQHVILDFDSLAVDALASKVQDTKLAKVAKPQDDKEVQIGITVKKMEDFSTWYSQVVVRTEMLEYYDISGCYIIRPWGYNIWKTIQNFFGGAIEDLGVEDCYFPMFIPERNLNKEKDHVEGFSPEVAWVTKAGKSDLAEPIAIRPTSETVMYPYYASWIRSHRDLPLRLNQWCNVIRWEFKHPQPFLRTREFLWQEGHTAFATKSEADQEVLQILDLYRRVFEDLLAVPVIPGEKSENEKFAGALYTTSVEGFIPATGRGIQGATSHCLGQNFSKMFEIMADNENHERVNVWQNSWGLSTRTIGVMVMVHGDDKGLILPPRVAQIQVIVVPVGITVKTSAEQRQVIFQKAQELSDKLKQGGIKSKADLRENYTPGYKFNHWELKGVPLRFEVGPKDISKNETRAVRRDTGASQQLSLEGIVSATSLLLETVQSDMLAKATAARDAQLVQLETWDGFVESLNQKKIILAPWCEQVACEKSVKERSSGPASEQDEKAPSMGAKTLNIPFKQPAMAKGKQCFACSLKAKRYALWGRSY